MVENPARAKSLFLAASEMTGDERAAFLDNECGPDETLRARVEALLKANDADPVAPITMDRAPANLSRDPLATQGFTDPTADVGSILADKYKIVEKIGEGGMGEVWEAVQAGTELSVAIKFLHSDLMRHSTARDRVKKEAKALELLLMRMVWF